MLWRNLIGQNRAVEILQAALEKKKIAPAYLFIGKLGIGKTKAAEIFASYLLAQDLAEEKHSLIYQRCLTNNHPDLLWVEPTYQHQGKLFTAEEASLAGLKRRSAPLIRIEQIREITEFITRPPLEAIQTVVVIKQAEKMAEPAANALLKTLEEPGKAVIILVATQIEDILPTLVSRSQRIPFYRLSTDNLIKVLEITGHQAIANHPELITLAQGSPGKLIEAWQQLQLIPADLLVRLTNPPADSLAAILLAKDLVKTIDNPSQLWLVDYLQSYYWYKLANSQIAFYLEQVRQMLLKYVNNRLVWECFFLKISPMIQ